MRFSIIIPVYNAAKYLKVCLDSIIGQTYKDFEIICINDASTDNSLEILKSYSEKYHEIHIIDNHENKGPSCRNDGLIYAKGDYILFVDSDDYISKNTLQICNERLKNRNVDILEFGCKVVFEHDCIQDNFISIEEYVTEINTSITGLQWFSLRFNEKKYLGVIWAKVFNRRFLSENNISFYEGIFHEDELFLIHCLIKAQRVISCTERLYIYRRRNASVTTQKSKIKNLDSYVIVLNEVSALWKDEVDKEVQAAIKVYKKMLLKRIKYLMITYPEHNKMLLGKSKDQELFNQIYAMDCTFIREKKSFTEKELVNINKYKSVLVYGAGAVAIEVLQLLEENRIFAKGVVVTQKTINEDTIMGYKVEQIDEWVGEKENVLVIVAVSKKKQPEIVENLQRIQFKNILCIES